MRSDPPRFLQTLLRAAIRAADPALAVPPHLPSPPRGRTIAVGAGKAAIGMARAVEDHWPADAPLSGVVAAPAPATLRRIAVIESAHPVPDVRSLAAAQAVRAALRGLGPDDVVLALMSGGGSALLAEPAPGLDLAAKQSVTAALLRSGASIAEINTVRRHLSAIKGGHLAAICAPAGVHALLISDVPSDDPGTIASGPFHPDPTTIADAASILHRYGLPIPAGLQETPKPSDPVFARVRTTIVASGATALQAAAGAAREAGLAVLNLGAAIEGESREVARAIAGVALSCVLHGAPLAPPCVIISGGETTVTVRGRGQGGRNTEFALALTLALDGHPRIWAIAADTDGRDGTGPAAGALVRPGTLGCRAAARQALAAQDSAPFFAAAGDLIMTGLTGTNVNDFRAVLIV